jgi:hypothetical protein
MRKKLRYNSTKLVHNNMLSNTQSQYIVHVPHDVVAEQLGPNPKMACDLGQLSSIIKDMSTLHNFQINVLKGK